MLFLATFPSPVLAQEDPQVARAREILEEIDDLYRSASSKGRLRMQVSTAHYTRTLVMESWSKGKEKSLVRILAPLKEKGTVSLKNDNNMYTYLPKTDRVIRLTSGMMMGSWMGSHFTNDDLVKESRLSEDYDPRITFEGERDGESIIEFTLTPKPDAPVVWGKIITEIFSKSRLPLRSAYYDEDGELTRTIVFSNIQPMGGRKLPTILSVVPTDKPDEHTELIYEEIVFDLELPESMFSLMQLRRR